MDSVAAATAATAATAAAPAAPAVVAGGGVGADIRRRRLLVNNS